MCRLRKDWLAATLLVLCWSLAPAGLARAQSTNAIITGNVVDSNGGVLPGVTVTATNEETGLVRAVVTGGRGAYQINALPPGRYAVQIALVGFGTEKRTGVVLTIGATVPLNFVMKPANINESVTVTGAAPLVDTTSSQISTAIAPRQVDQLPLVGRQFMDLANLAPGVSIDRRSASAASDDVSFGGFSETYKSIWLEGMDVNDVDTRGGSGLSNASRLTFTQESVQEFQVMSTAYSVEFGQSATGVINILTKSGTNQYHGRGFYFLRDRSFQKPNALATGNPPFREQQSGGTIGGPIRRDRMWFFATYENQYLNESAAVTIPSFVLPIITDSRTNLPQPGRENNLFGKLTTSLSPTEYLNVVGLFGRQTFKNNDVGGDVAGDGGDNKVQHDEFFDAALTSVWSNNLTNELKVAWSDSLKNRPPNGPVSPRVAFPSIEYGTGTDYFQGRDEKNVTLMDTLHLHRETGWGTHDLKFGGTANVVHEVDADDREEHGVFTFLKDQLPVAGDLSTYPVSFEIRQGSLPINLDLQHYDAYAEDAWRPVSNVTVTAGVRYDITLFNDNGYAQLPTDMPTPEFLARFLTGDLPHGDKYKPAPDQGKVSPRVSVAWDPAGDGRTVVRGGFGLYYGARRTATDDGVIDGYPIGPAQAFANDVRVTGIPNLFFPNIPDLSTLSSAGSSSVTVPNPAGGKDVETEQASIGIEHQLGKETSLSVNYLHMLGLHFPMTYNINARRPDGTYPISATGISMRFIDPSGRIQSDQVQFIINQRLAHHVSLQASYTYLRFFQNDSDPVDKQHIFLNNFGPGPNDVRHRLVFSGSYTLPHAVRVSGIVTATSAAPYTITTGTDDNDDRDLNDRPIVDGVMVTPYSARGDRYFRTDMRISHTFELGGSKNLEVLWEMNNLFNTVNYGGYVGNMSSVRFGQPRYALTPFQGQLGMRFNF